MIKKNYAVQFLSFEVNQMDLDIIFFVYTTTQEAILILQLYSGKYKKKNKER
jgi:hypothetical protein